MITSVDWLSRYVDIPWGVEELAERLTVAGLEAESVSRTHAIPDGVVVAEVLLREPHPDADKLSLCEVSVGEGEPLSVVCGAPNCDVGLRVPPSYSSAELGKALKAADAAFGCHKCNSTGSIKGSVCPECQGHPPDAMTPAAYRKFCRLGEVLTFAADKADVAGLARRKSAGRDLLVLVGKNAAVNVPQTGDLASRLLDSPERDGNGILLGGTILEVHAQDKGHAAKLKLAKVDSTVLLLSKTALPLAAEDRVLVLGSIVDDPAEKLVGFDTPQPPVVWFGARAKF